MQLHAFRTACPAAASLQAPPLPTVALVPPPPAAPAPSLQAERRRRQLRETIEERQQAMAVQLAREEEAHQAALVARQAKREGLERHNREMGVAAREARVEAYMKQHTVGGQTMLDPTGGWALGTGGGGRGPGEVWEV